MKFTVICPVVQVPLFWDLFGCIRVNKKSPDQIIVINNAGSRFNVDHPSIQVVQGPMGVNQSWEKARTMVNDDIDCVSILNDDIIIRSDFFSSAEELFTEELRCGVCCPVTVKNQTDIGLVIPMLPTFMSRREGWAFTIRKWLLDKIPPIPYKQISTYCGDDWYWYWTHRRGYRWFYNTRTCIYHYGSVSVRQLQNCHPLLKTEKREYAKIIEEIENGTRDYNDSEREGQRV